MCNQCLITTPEIYGSVSKDSRLNTVKQTTQESWTYTYNHRRITTPWFIQIPYTYKFAPYNGPGAKFTTKAVEFTLNLIFDRLPEFIIWLQSQKQQARTWKESISLWSIHHYEYISAYLIWWSNSLIESLLSAYMFQFFATETLCLLNSYERLPIEPCSPYNCL